MWVLIGHYISIQLESNFYVSLSSNPPLYPFYLSIFLSHFQNTPPEEEGVMEFLNQFL